MKKVLIYTAFERFWHWLQAILIMFLALTGFEIHGSFTLFGFENAVSFHIYSSYMLLILIVFAIFWHLTTGDWRQYIPTTKYIKAYFKFYISDIFHNAPHPTKKTVLSRLNPLQKIVYVGFKIILIPLMVATGVLYLFYRFPQGDTISSINVANLSIIGELHTLGAYLLMTFLIGHLYLITTGHSVFSNLNSMLTGCECIDEDENDDNNNDYIKGHCDEKS